jgi:hypothetical protein
MENVMGFIEVGNDVLFIVSCMFVLIVWLAR